MPRQARVDSEFGRWIEHFEDNGPVHESTDAAIAGRPGAPVPAR